MGMQERRAGRTPRRAHTRRALALVALAIGLSLWLPPAALAGSAIDQYSLDLPDAKGKVESPESAPSTHVGSLPPTVAAELARDPQGRALAAIATAGELGAPPSPPPGDLVTTAVAGSQLSSFGAIGSGRGAPAVIGVVLLPLLLGGIALVSRIRRRPAGS